MTAAFVWERIGEAQFLAELREPLKSRSPSGVGQGTDDPQAGVAQAAALECDITARFDEISPSALMDRVRARIGDKRLLALVKAFLKVGILTEAGTSKETVTGTPQG
ncbi:hypothetical protein [Streptomyces sp. NPDC055085]